MIINKTMFTFLLIVLSITVYADADGPDYFQVQGVEEHHSLNIRSEASIKSKKIGKIPAFSNCVKNLGCKDGLTMSEFLSLPKEKQVTAKKDHPGWCQIEYQGVKGWVSNEFLIEGNCDTSDVINQSETIRIEGYAIDVGSERSGGDYYKDFATDVADCARWCSREKRCKGFDYHKELGACWVKDKIYPMRPNPNIVTGIKNKKK